MSIKQILIERCWSTDPKSRPTFDDIVEELKSNPDFITERVDEDIFKKYIKEIDEAPISFDHSRKIQNAEENINFILRNFASFNFNINLSGIYETEPFEINPDSEFFDIKKIKRKRNNLCCFIIF